MGKFRHGWPYLRGELLVDFCRNNELFITYTMFWHRERRKVTWRSSDDWTSNMIDIILVRKRWTSSVLNTVSLASGDFISDHVLVMSELHMRLQKPQPPKKLPKIPCWPAEKHQNNKHVVLSNKLSSIQLTGVPTLEEVDHLVEESASIIRETANEILGEQSCSDKPWITPETIITCPEKMYSRQPTRPTKTRMNTRGETSRRKRSNWLCINESTTSAMNSKTPLRKVRATKHTRKCRTATTTDQLAWQANQRRSSRKSYLTSKIPWKTSF